MIDVGLGITVVVLRGIGISLMSVA